MHAQDRDLKTKLEKKGWTFEPLAPNQRGEYYSSEQAHEREWELCCESHVLDPDELDLDEIVSDPHRVVDAVIRIGSEYWVVTKPVGRGYNSTDWDDLEDLDHDWNPN